MCINVFNSFVQNIKLSIVWEKLDVTECDELCMLHNEIVFEVDFVVHCVDELCEIVLENAKILWE